MIDSVSHRKDKVEGHHDGRDWNKLHLNRSQYVVNIGNRRGVRRPVNRSVQESIDAIEHQLHEHKLKVGQV